MAILIDVMPIDKSVLGFSNRWYKDAQANAIDQKITDTINVKIISAPYFLATKLEAFKDRGNQDFLSSHDLEDIISLIDGRPEIVNDISAASINKQALIYPQILPLFFEQHHAYICHNIFLKNKIMFQFFCNPRH